MKITTRSRYALRFMLELSNHAETGKVKISEISERQGLSSKYLENIAITLKAAKFIQASRGKNGGYTLAGKPEDYTVGRILALFEDNLNPSTCEDCEILIEKCSGNCSVIQLRNKLDLSVDEVLENTTLADLVKWERVI